MKYTEIRVISERQLDEIRMAPSNLRQFLNSPAAEGIRAGFEAELIFPDVLHRHPYETELEPEPDYEQDERCTSIDDVINFFSQDQGDINPRRARQQMENDYDEWREAAISRDFHQNAEELIHNWILDNIEDTDIEVDPDTGPLESDVEARVAEAIRREDGIWDAARELHQEAAWDDDDYNEASWFENNFEYMTDVENHYGYIWPHWLDPNSDDRDSEPGYDINVAQDLAQSLEVDLEVGTRVASGYHSAPRNDRDWIFEPDSSLEPDDSDTDMPVEIVTPPMPLATTVDMLDKFFRWAKKHDAYANTSTGFHMSVSLPGQLSESDAEGKRIDFVKLALFLGDQYVLDQFDRSLNTYCASALGKIKDAAANRTDNRMNSAIEEFRQGLMAQAGYALTSSYGFGKYTSINPKSGYIEFRSAGNKDYFADVEKLQDTLLRYAYAMSIAGDPAAERAEYAKKLYKILAKVELEDVPGTKGGRRRQTVVPSQPDQDPMYLFTSYIVGKINLGDLKSQLRSINFTREAQRPRYRRWLVTQLSGEREGQHIELMARTELEAKNLACTEWQMLQRDYNRDQLEAIPLDHGSKDDAQPTATGNVKVAVRRRDANGHATGPVRDEFEVPAGDGDATNTAIERWCNDNGEQRRQMWFTLSDEVDPELMNDYRRRLAAVRGPAADLDGWYALRRRGGGRGVIEHQGAGRILYQFQAATSSEAIDKKRQWCEQNNMPYFDIWLELLENVPEPIRQEYNRNLAQNSQAAPAAPTRVPGWREAAAQTLRRTYPDVLCADPEIISPTGQWVVFSGSTFYNLTTLPASNGWDALWRFHYWVSDIPEDRRDIYRLRPADQRDIEYTNNLTTPNRTTPEPPVNWDGGPPVHTEPEGAVTPIPTTGGGEFTGRWNIISSRTGESLHTFGGIGNVQADALGVARDWAQQTGFDDPIEVYPIMR